MWFVIRAAFWLAVVGAFMPRDVHAEPDMLAETRVAALADAEEFCADQPDVCAAGEQAAILGAAAGRATLHIVLDKADEAALTQEAGAATDALAAAALPSP
jgi:hypothetical protein